ALVDLDSIAFQIEYPIGKSAAWIFLYSDKLCRIYIFPWFAIFGGTRHCCLQLYLLLLFLCHWSQWQPLEPYGNFFRNLAHSLRTVPTLLTPSFMSPTR